jgi:hypothetical protein
MNYRCHVCLVLGISSDPVANMLSSLIYILFKEPESIAEVI